MMPEDGNFAEWYFEQSCYSSIRPSKNLERQHASRSRRGMIQIVAGVEWELYKA